MLITSRAISFIMADGILPSNEGRGYVLRRILRRAVRHGHVLGLKKPFLYTLTDIVKDTMGDIYPEIKEAHPLIKEITQKEEERFLETLDFGLKLLTQEIEKIRQKTVHILPGETAFKLYDTYGFPIDIITDMAREEGVEVDIAGFEKAMALQKSRAREAQKAGTDILTGIDIYTEFTYRGEKTVFVGYETLETRSKITHLIKKGKELKSIRVGEECELITEKTPFYGESGGQGRGYRYYHLGTRGG
ncbi:Alanine--tRNA ligase [Candidatus Methanoperedenaceae archaeon GB37]|nr:Alanine--tRNA ligase [Candidatus Methanoperedenaceae archaeon GB37]